VFLLPVVSRAQEGKVLVPQTINLCKVQIDLYCGVERDKKDFREIIQCLIKNNDKLSTECKQEIQRYAQASRQTTPPGGGPLGALGGMTGLTSQVPSIGYEGRWLPDRHNSARPSLTEHSLNVSVPVYKTEIDTISTTASGASLHMSEPIALDSGIKVPNDLYRADIGIQYSQRLSGKRMWGVRGSLGYAGEEFSKKTESFSVSTNYSFPGSNESHWVLMLMMSNNSPFGTSIPIPGFFYIYKTQTFTGLFGLPVLSLQWTPVNPWSFSLSAFGPQIKTEAAYGTIDDTQSFIAFNWKQQRFILSEHTNNNERLTLEEKNAEVGFRRPLWQGVFSEFQTGYSFDRSIYLGEGLLNKDGGTVNLASSWYLRWSIKIAF